jgi:hypothetical protein
MKFAIYSFIFIIDEFECMRTVSIHMTKAVRCTTIAEQKHDLMRGFRTKCDKVPEHVHILNDEYCSSAIEC